MPYKYYFGIHFLCLCREISTQSALLDTEEGGSAIKVLAVVDLRFLEVGRMVLHTDFELCTAFQAVFLRTRTVCVLTVNNLREA